MPSATFAHWGFSGHSHERIRSSSRFCAKEDEDEKNDTPENDDSVVSSDRCLSVDISTFRLTEYTEPTQASALLEDKEILFGASFLVAPSRNRMKMRQMMLPK